MPFGGSFASLISDVPASIELNDGQQHGFTEVRGIGLEQGDDVESCQNDSSIEAGSGFCGKTSKNVVTMEGTSMGNPLQRFIIVIICLLTLSPSLL